MASQNNGERRIDIPPAPTDRTSSSSSNGDPSAPGLGIPILIVLNVIQIVASVVGLWVSIVHEHPDHKIIAWFVGYASGCAVMLALHCFGYCTARTPSLLQYRAMIVLSMTLCCFFPVWIVFGFVSFVGAVSCSYDALGLEIILQAFLFPVCLLYATPGLGFAFICQRVIWEKPRGASTPDSPIALPTYKFKSKENGGGVLLTAGTKKERTLSGEDVVCCICLGEYEDNDEVRELTCCSHFFHVECVDKWMTIKARCPLCQSELGGAGGAAT